MGSRNWLGLVLLTFLSALLPVRSFAASAAESSYKGWQTLEVKNDLVSAQLAPDIGGRIIQFKLGDHEFLWVNPDLAGKLPPETGLGPKGEWLNYGGDKLWPAPQGWGGPDEWPGPPGADIEGKPHTAQIITARGTTATVVHTSPKDPYSGIRFTRKIAVVDGAAGLRLDSTMTNVDTKPRRWGIWQVTQLDCSAPGGKGWSEKIRAYTPMNPKSLFPRGFKVLYGPEDNPAWQPDHEKKIFRAHYVRQVGKVGLDSMAGWLAVVDGRTGRAFVERFETFPEKKYPDNSSVEFWIQAPGKFQLPNEEVAVPDTPRDAPPYMEAEVLSPFAELRPGESYTFRNEWYAANVGDGQVIECTSIGLVCIDPKSPGLPWVPPPADAGFGTQLHINATFGVFYKGTARLKLFTEQGDELATPTLSIPVAPGQILAFPYITIPSQAKRLAICIHDPNGALLGELVRLPIHYSDWLIKQ